MIYYQLIDWNGKMKSLSRSAAVAQLREPHETYAHMRGIGCTYSFGRGVMLDVIYCPQRGEART